jgi:hypothetical protein
MRSGGAWMPGNGACGLAADVGARIYCSDLQMAEMWEGLKHPPLQTLKLVYSRPPRGFLFLGTLKEISCV